MLVLLIEDNRNLAANIIEYLAEDGHECDYAATGNLGLELALKQTYDAIILDINLPDTTGIKLCQTLRAQGKSLPIIMLTARDTLENKLEGFNAGADDYLVKPFAMAELSARINALARCNTTSWGQLQVADLTLDLDSREVTRGNSPIQLSKACWEILVMLMQASPKVVTREQMEQKVWQGSPPESDSLKSHIYQLRQNIDKPFEHKLISTVRGVGLVLAASADC